MPEASGPRGYYCLCGYLCTTAHILFKHIRRWGPEEPGRHVRVQGPREQFPRTGVEWGKAPARPSRG